MSNAICPGSFDPVTLGHLDIIKRASLLFEKVIVAVMVNPAKKAAFTSEERVELLRRALPDLPNVEIMSFNGLLVDFAYSQNANVILKGLRAVSDFEYEFQMALANKKLGNDIETVFLPTNSENMFLSSSVVKQIASFGGDISPFVPEVICEDIRKRLNQRG